MKAVTVKLPEATLDRLRDEARATGRSVSDLIRERVEAQATQTDSNVHALAGDLAGSVAGSRQPATNERRKFGRS
jgi:hypothetical protein